MGACEGRLATNHLDAAIRHEPAERAGDVTDHLLLAIDEGRPIEPRLAHDNAVDACPFDLVQRVARRDQHLLRRAAPVRAGAAELAWLDHRHRHAGSATAQNHHIVFFGAHRTFLPAAYVTSAISVSRWM